MALSKEKENQIELCYISGKSINETAKIIGCHRDTIEKRYIKYDKNSEICNIKNDTEKAKMERYATIPDRIRNDSRLDDILDTIITTWNNEEYIQGLANDGRHSDINKIFGTITDKGFKVRQLDLEERKLQLEEESNNVVNIKIVDDLGDLDE